MVYSNIAVYGKKEHGKNQSLIKLASSFLKHYDPFGMHFLHAFIFTPYQ